MVFFLPCDHGLDFNISLFCDNSNNNNQTDSKKFHFFRHLSFLAGTDIIQLSFVVVSHIQRIGCQPPKTTLHGGQSRSWFAEQGKENKIKKFGSALPPPPPPPP